MRNKSYMYGLFAAGVMVFLPVSATVYIPEPITYYYDAAETVARIRVMGGELLQGEFEGESYPCGQRVKAEVIESFKGEDESVEFIMEGMVLKMGEDYLVFIERAESERGERIASTNSFHAREELRRQAACQDVAKTHTASWLSTARFLRHFNYHSQEVESWLWPAYNISIPEGADIQFSP